MSLRLWRRQTTALNSTHRLHVQYKSVFKQLFKQQSHHRHFIFHFVLKKLLHNPAVQPLQTSRHSQVARGHCQLIHHRSGRCCNPSSSNGSLHQSIIQVLLLPLYPIVLHSSLHSLLNPHTTPHQTPPHHTPINSPQI